MINKLEMPLEQFSEAVAKENARLNNRIEQLEAAYAQQQQVWSDAIARADRYEEALRQICDGPRDGDKSYAELFAEVCREARAALGEKMGMYKHKMPDREQSSEMSRADYWEAQASMWHENYKEAMAHEEEARRYKVALERIRDSGYGTKERIRLIIMKALGEKKDG